MTSRASTTGGVVHDLTRKHDETLERLQVQESKERRNRWTVIISLLGALGAGGGAGGAYLQDIGNDESVKTVVATHVATYEQWRDGADGDLKQLMVEQQQLRDAVIRLQVTVEMLSDKHRGGTQLREGLAEVERLLEGIGHRRKTRASKANPEAVKKYKADLFGDD